MHGQEGFASPYSSSFYAHRKWGHDDYPVGTSGTLLVWRTLLNQDVFRVDASPEGIKGELLFTCPCQEGLVVRVERTEVPFDGSEEDLYALKGEDPDIIRKVLPNAVYVVTRSYRPEDKRPWKRTGRRTYLWLVALEDRELDKGRRIEWGGSTRLFPTRKAALEYLYS